MLGHIADLVLRPGLRLGQDSISQDLAIGDPLLKRGWLGSRALLRHTALEPLEFKLMLPISLDPLELLFPELAGMGLPGQDPPAGSGAQHDQNDHQHDAESEL